MWKRKILSSESKIGNKKSAYSYLLASKLKRLRNDKCDFLASMNTNFIVIGDYMKRKVWITQKYFLFYLYM